MIAKDIFKKIDSVSKKNKIPAYIVGGYVRDLLMGRGDKKDIDIVVVGSGIEFAKKFDEAMKQAGSLVEFIDFDTARYIIGEGEETLILEFAGARCEVYESASRKPKVTAGTLAEDLTRRDFTVNTLAVPSSAFSGLRTASLTALKKKIVDDFHGQEDITNKILRTPLDPDVTFGDDPLRMMRALRFSAQLGFSVEPKTLEAIYRNRERIKIVSAERIQEELLKLLSAPQPSIGLLLMFQTHLLDIILPEVSKLDGVEEVFGHQHKNNLIHSFKVVDNIAENSSNVWLRLAGLLHDIGKAPTKKFIPKLGWTFHAHEHVGKKMAYQIARRLKFANDKTDYLAKLIRWHLQPIALMDEGITDSAVRRLVVTMGDELDDLLILGRGDITTGNPYKKEKRLKNYDNLKKKINELLERDKLRAFQSPFRGDEIMKECGLKPGPTVGKIKTALEEAILDGVVPNDHDAVRDYFEKIKGDYIKNAADWERIV